MNRNRTLRLVSETLLAVAAAMLPATSQSLGQDSPTRPLARLVADDAVKAKQAAAERQRRKGEWKLAARLYRELDAESGHRLVELQNTEGERQDGLVRFVTLRTWVRRRLAETYRGVEASIADDPPARQRLNTALRGGEESTLRQLAEDFAGQPLGGEAWEALGEVYLERAQFGRAIEAWLWKTTMRPDAYTLARTAFAHAQLGERSAVYDILQQFEADPHRKATGRIAGRSEGLAGYVNGLAERMTAGERTPGAGWPMRGGVAARSAVGAAWRGFGEHLWTVNASSAAMPAVARDMVFCLDESGTLVARDLRTGRLRWKADLPAAAKAADPASSPTVSGDQVLLAKPNEPGTLVAVDVDTGKSPSEQRYPADGEGAVVDDSPVVEDGILYCGVLNTAAGKTSYWLRAAEQETRRAWWQVPVCEVTARVPVPVAAFGSSVFVCPGGGVVAALDGASGEFRWAVTYPLRPSRKPGVKPCPPIVTNGVVVAAPPDAEVILGLSLLDGAIRWSRPREGTEEIMASAGGAVLLVGSTVTAIDVCTGKSLRWKEDGTKRLGVWVAGNRVLVSDASGLVVLDASRGKREVVPWPVETPPGRVLTADQVVLVAAKDSLAAFEQRPTP